MSSHEGLRSNTPANGFTVRRRAAATVATVGLLVPGSWAVTTVTGGPGATATAAASTSTSTAKKVKVTPKKTLRIARKQRGKPYRYGAAGPNAFDCSGLVKYVMKKQKTSVPRTANAQYHSAKKIKKSRVKLGDLIFFYSGSSIYHVGIYAGHHRIWHSPRPGKNVSRVKIWTSSWKVGRVTA